ncbi:MAG: DUF620 domain-containing protein [Bryobacteraceae bacterium]
MKRLPIRQTLAACAVMVLAAAGATLRAADDQPKAAAPTAPRAEAQAPAVPRAADVLPKAETILDKSVEAAGGKAAFEKLHNTVITGSMELAAMGIKGTMTITKAEPDKSLDEIEITGLGSVKQGYDGKVAWEINPMQGARIKDGDESAQTKIQAHFHEENWRDEYKKVETVGAETVDGKDCYKLVLTPNEGKPVTQFFDKKTWLLTKIALTVNTPMGEVESETLISDYRKEGDLLVAHKIVQTAGGQEIAITLDTYKYNVEIPKGKFDLPDEIKALVK